jgi:hypothetical protein
METVGHVRAFGASMFKTGVRCAMAKKTAVTEKPQEMAAEALKNPALIRAMIDGLSAPDSSKLRRAKALNLLSASHPALLYPYYDFFAGMLDSPHKILKWNAVIILGNLAGVDTAHRFDAIFDRYYRHLWDGDLITAANVIDSSGKIARARPDLQARITAEILNVEAVPLPTDECREIARGKALTALTGCLSDHRQNPGLTDLARKCLDSRRPATRKKAEVWLKVESPREKTRN